MYQDNVTSYAGTLSSSGNLTWSISPDDPDQINGSLQYSLYMNTTNAGSTLCSAATGTATACGWVRNNISHVAVTGRPGWLRQSGGTGFFFGAGSNACALNDAELGNIMYHCAFNMTAWGSGAVEGNPSCLINLTLDRSGSQSQCGNNITETPAGLTAFTHTTSSSTQEGLLQARWPLSVDDENQTVGNGSYHIRALSTTENGVIFELVNATDVVDGADSMSGFRTYNLTIGGTARHRIGFQVYMMEPFLYMISNWTCIASIDSGVFNDVGNCNGIDGDGVFEPENSTLTGGEILFPIVDTGVFGEATGIPDNLVGWFFALIWIGILAGIGIFAFKTPMWGIAGATLGFASAGLFGLISLWVIILSFAGALIVILLVGRGDDA